MKRQSEKLRDNPQEVVTKLFRISSSSVIEIKDNTQPKDKGRPTTAFVALAALIWAKVIQARKLLLVSEEQKHTRPTLAVVADLRNHHLLEDIHLESPKDYLGNLVYTTPATLHLYPKANFESQVKPKTLVPVISKSIGIMDKDWAKSQLSQICWRDYEKTPHARCLFPNGPDLYITTWRDMGADDEWSIPGISSPIKATAIRRLAWKGEGYHRLA
ncbi:hypothetical protein BDW02DRAFT_567390, partial [Decorospora gaudefroyi]